MSILAAIETSDPILFIWAVVKIVVPFWVLSIIRHRVLRGPKRDPDFDNHPYVGHVGHSLGTWTIVGNFGLTIAVVPVRGHPGLRSFAHSWEAETMEEG